MSYRAAIFIPLTIFGILLLGSHFVVEYREHRCAERCKAAGAAGYEYRGFSGGRNLRGDVCSCVNKSTP